LRRCLIALSSAWLVLSLTLTRVTFPALIQHSSLCDGVDDDDSLWEPTMVERDGLRIADEAVISKDSHNRDPVSGSSELRPSGSPRPRHDLRTALRPSYASHGKSGDEDSLEPH